MPYVFPDKSENLKKWKPESVSWMKELETVTIPPGNWNALHVGNQSREIGVIHGVIYGNLHSSYTDKDRLNNLFPISLRLKVIGESYLEGLLDGLVRAATTDRHTHNNVFHCCPFVVVVK